jgi:hypothetical protein
MHRLFLGSHRIKIFLQLQLGKLPRQFRARQTGFCCLDLGRLTLEVKTARLRTSDRLEREAAKARDSLVTRHHALADSGHEAGDLSRNRSIRLHTGLCPGGSVGTAISNGRPMNRPLEPIHPRSGQIGFALGDQPLELARQISDRLGTDCVEFFVLLEQRQLCPDLLIERERPV